MSSLRCRLVLRLQKIFLITGNIYRARNLILGIEEPPISADIPFTYHLPCTTSPSSPFPNSDLLPTPTNANPNEHPMSPLVSPLFSPTWQYPPTPAPQNGPPFVGMMQQPKFLYNVMQQSVGSSG